VVGIEVFGGHVEETAVAELRAGVERGAPLVAVALVGGAVLRVDAHAVGVIVEQHVDHAGDGVGAVLRGRAVAQHFHALDRGGRDQAVIDRLRTLVHRAERFDLQVHQRRAMASLAVDQHQGLVRRQVAQVGRTHERGAVGDREALRVERRRNVGQLVGEVGRGLLLQVRRTEDIDRGHRFGGRAALHAGAGDDELVEVDGLLAGGRCGGGSRGLRGILREGGGYGSRQCIEKQGGSDGRGKAMSVGNEHWRFPYSGWADSPCRAQPGALTTS